MERPDFPAAVKTEEVTKPRLFIGNLAESVTEAVLLDTFLVIGEVEDVSVVQNQKQNAVRPWVHGFVTYNDALDADEAILKFQGVSLEGRPMVVRYDRARNTPRVVPRRNTTQYGRQLFVGNLSYSTSWQDLKDHFRFDGAFDVRRAEVFMKVNPQKSNQTYSKGCGLVLMGTEEDAERAVEHFNDSDLQGRKIIVKMDAPREQREVFDPVIKQI